MKIVILDLETTGLDIDYCSVLQLSAMFVDTEQPLSDSTFNAYIHHEDFYCESNVLKFHQKLFEKVLTEGVPPQEACNRFNAWLGGFFNLGETITVAGKNVGNFDYPFLKRLFGYKCVGGSVETGMFILGQRVLDIGSLYFRAEDDGLRSLKQLCADENIPFEETHEGMADCLAIKALLLKKLK